MRTDLGGTPPRIHDTRVKQSAWMGRRFVSLIAVRDAQAHCKELQGEV